MITHIVSDWLFSPCCVEHQDEFIFERVAVAYSRDYNEVGRAQIKQLVTSEIGVFGVVWGISMDRYFPSVPALRYGSLSF